MPFLRSLNHFFGLYRATFRRLLVWRVWSALTLYAALSALVLVALLYYLNPLVYSLMRPYLQGVGSLVAGLGIAPNLLEQFSHYPAHFYLMPSQYEWAKLPLALLFEGLALSFAARAFAESYLGVERNSSFAVSVLGLWLQTAAIWAIMYLIISALSYALPELVAEWLKGSPRRLQVFEFILFSASILAITPLVYAIPSLATATGRDRWTNLGGALLRSLRLFGRYPFSSFLLIYLPALLFAYPLVWAVSPNSGLTVKLKPEMTFVLLLVTIVGNLFWNLLYVGAATRLAIEEKP